MEISEAAKLDKELTVCFSGHRPSKLPKKGDESEQITQMLKSFLYKEITRCIDDGYNTFITGLAKGVDLWAGGIVIDLMAKNKDIRLISAMPYRDHPSGFFGEEKWALGNILQKSSGIFYISEEYSPACMRKRNEFMIDNSSKLIAMVKSYRSGTGQTIRYARKSGIEVKVIDIESIELETEGIYNYSLF